MAKSKKKLKNRAHRTHNRLRALRNPAGKRHYRLRRRQNPFGFTWPVFFEMAGFAIAGGVAARALPQAVVPNYNSGIPGYGMNAVTTALAAFVAGLWKKEAALGAALGGTVMTVGRIVSDYFGKQLVTFSLLEPTTGVATPAAVTAAPTTTTTALSQGDLHFDLRGYKSTYFPLPTVTDPKTGVVTKPWGTDLSKLQAMIAASATTKGGHGTSAASRPSKVTSMHGGRYGTVM